MKKDEKTSHIFLGYKAYGPGNKLICDTTSYSVLVNTVRLRRKKTKHIEVVEVYREVHYFQATEQEIEIDDN